jgi:hypothetical protein
VPRKKPAKTSKSPNYGGKREGAGRIPAIVQVEKFDMLDATREFRFRSMRGGKAQALEMNAVQFAFFVVCQAAMGNAGATQLAAANSLLDRRWGRATQTTEIQGSLNIDVLGRMRERDRMLLEADAGIPELTAGTVHVTSNGHLNGHLNGTANGHAKKGHP